MNWENQESELMLTQAHEYMYVPEWAWAGKWQVAQMISSIISSLCF